MAGFVVYILHSEKLDKFYIGTSDDFENRFREHNTEIKPDSFTLRGRPWKQFFVINNLTSKQAYSIEKHIKQMKSTKYIENLAKYSQIIERLRARYQ
jgi:putative endonuclease